MDDEDDTLVKTHCRVIRGLSVVDLQDNFVCQVWT